MQTVVAAMVYYTHLFLNRNFLGSRYYSLICGLVKTLLIIIQEVNYRLFIPYIADLHSYNKKS